MKRRRRRRKRASFCQNDQIECLFLSTLYHFGIPDSLKNQTKISGSFFFFFREKKKKKKSLKKIFFVIIKD